MHKDVWVCWSHLVSMASYSERSNYLKAFTGSSQESNMANMRRSAQVSKQLSRPLLWLSESYKNEIKSWSLPFFSSLRAKESLLPPPNEQHKTGCFLLRKHCFPSYSIQNKCLNWKSDYCILSTLYSHRNDFFQERWHLYLYIIHKLNFEGEARQLAYKVNE